MATIIEIKTKDELDEILQQETSVIVDFHATWCGPCKMLSKYLQTLPDTLKIYSVDTGDFVLHNIKSVPTMIKFENGEETGRHLGFSDPQSVKDFIG